MPVASISSASTASTTRSQSQSQNLGQADFIRLMTTQMKMQDPTDPVDNKEMIAQMAQFSSLSGIETINSTLKAISAQLDRVLSTQAATPTANPE
ncbi:MAG: hypothetical protein RL299_357 [Pseudomonadota bacterium]